MKKCLVCGHDCNASAVSCPKCGEGSFAPVAPEPTKEPEPKTEQPRRGRR